jgi:hypothetical protein
MSDRNTWDTHWLDLQKFISPRQGTQLTNKKEDRNDGKKKHTDIINGTPTKAAGVLAAGMQGGLTSPSRPWFRLSLADTELLENEDVKSWLQFVRDLMLDVFARSNFYGSVHGIYEELGVFGTGAMLIEEDLDTVIRCKPYTIGEYYLGLSRLNRPEILYRRFTMTATQLISEFGKGNVSESVRKAVTDKQGESKFTVIHCIQPRNERDVGRVDSANMAFESVYFEEGSPENKTPDNESRDDKFLRISGYRGNPFVAPRWSTIGGQTYGRCPGMDALGDSKQLQKMETKKLKALDKLVDPPMNAPPSLKKVGGGTIVAGGVNYVDVTQGQQSFSPAYQVQINLQDTAFEIDRVERRIERLFFNDLFLSIIAEEKTMTAREVIERSSEKLIMLGPTLERLQTELFDVIIDRTFEIMDNFGMIPPAPPEIQNFPLKVEYISILAQAQKLAGLTGIETLVGTVGGWASVNPEVLDKIDFDEAVDEYGETIGTPAKLIRSDDDVAVIRQQRAQQLAQAQAQEQAAQMAETAQVASQTPVGGGEDTMLDTLIGGLTGQ